MKITASKRDDILKRQSEYEEEFRRQQDAFDAQVEAYKRQQDILAEKAKATLEKLFSTYDMLSPSIRIDTWGAFRRKGLQVYINVNEDKLHSGDSALSWSFNAYLNADGEVVRETSSWSGLQGVTSSQLDSLEQTYLALRKLAAFDWESLLNQELPKYSEYVTLSQPNRRDAPDFQKELDEVELEDIIGQRKMIKVQPFAGSDFYATGRYSRNDPVYVAIIKDSGSQYTIVEVSQWDVRRGNASERFDNASQHRVKKANIHPVHPIEIIDV